MNKQQLIRRLHQDLRISPNYYKTSRTDEISETERNVAIGQLKEAGIVAKDKRKTDQAVLMDALLSALKKLDAKPPRNRHEVANMTPEVVEEILKDPHASSRDIAARCGKSESTVDRYRTQLRKEGRCPPRHEDFG